MQASDVGCISGKAMPAPPSPAIDLGDSPDLNHRLYRHFEFEESATRNASTTSENAGEGCRRLG